MTNSSRWIAAVLATLIATAPAFAQDMDDDDVAPEGSVDRLDLQKRDIVIGDGLYKLPASVRVFDGRNRERSVLDLREGMQVRYSYQQANQQSPPAVTEIWIIGNANSGKRR